jgi:hypothetical protein
MKKMIAVVVAGLFLMAAAAPVYARGNGGGGRGGHGGSGFRGGRPGHHHFHHGFRSGVVIGGGVWLGPYWDPYWYPGYPYYPYSYGPYPYAPAAVVDEPQTYIEQSGPGYWYYCEAAKAYYPYVRECPGGWLTVQPQAAPEPKQ